MHIILCPFPEESKPDVTHRCVPFAKSPPSLVLVASAHRPSLVCQPFDLTPGKLVI